MNNACTRCGTTDRVVLVDGYGFPWCGECQALITAEIELGLAMLERYLDVKARRRLVVSIRGERTILDRILEYTEGDRR